jgi:BirA family biotin operon repressor/biotin-[acetyl-CoA-carboxylase] ligase
MGASPRSPLGSRAPLGGRRFTYLANVVLFESLPSTNDLGRWTAERLLAESTVIQPTAIVARRQTSGRGRGARTWSSIGEASLAISLILPWPDKPDRVRLPLRLGVVLARGLSSKFGIDVRLKWPNDLLVLGKKLGGILVEARAGAEGEGYAVAGIGLNVRATRAMLDAEQLPLATSLLIAGIPAAALGHEEVVSKVLEILDAGLSDPPADLAVAFAEVSAHKVGERITLADGGRETAGSFLGVTADGFLRLGTKGGEETVLSGDIASF